MLRNTILAGSLALTLCGCATSGGVTTIGGLDVKTIQSTAVAVCGFLPTAATVGNIIAAGNPILTTAEAIAEAICAAVSPAKAATRHGGALPTVSGVVIKGKSLR